MEIIEASLDSLSLNGRNSMVQPSARRHQKLSPYCELFLSSTGEAARFLSYIACYPTTDAARRVTALKIQMDNKEKNVDSNIRVQILNRLLLPEVFPNVRYFFLGDIFAIDQSKGVLLKGLRIPVTFFRQLSECSFSNIIVPQNIVTGAMMFVKRYMATYVECYESLEVPYGLLQPHSPLKKLTVTPDYNQHFYDLITNDPIAEARYRSLEEISLVNYLPLWHTRFITTVLCRIGRNVRRLTLLILHGTGTFDDLATWEPELIISPFLTDLPNLTEVTIKVAFDERLLQLLAEIIVLFIRARVNVVLSGLWTHRTVILNYLVLVVDENDDIYETVLSSRVSDELNDMMFLELEHYVRL